MKIIPLRDFVLVTKEESQERTSSGIYVGHVDEKFVRGKVVAVGSGKVTTEGKVVALDVKIDDKIAFNKNLATEVKEDGVTYLMLREDQILYKIESSS